MKKWRVTMKNEEIYALAAAAVKIPPARIRRSLGNLDDLKASIASKGQLHPIIITKEGVLISGERRLESCRELGITVLARYREDLSEADMVEIEVMENAARLDFTWLESVKATKKLHDYKVAHHGKAKKSGKSGSSGWGYAETGALVGKNEETIRLDCRVAEYLVEYPELTKLPRKTDAYKQIRTIIEDAALSELARRSTSGTITTGPIGSEEKFAGIEAIPAITPAAILLMEGLTDDEKAQAIAIIEAGASSAGKSAQEVVEESTLAFTSEYGQFTSVVAKRYIKGDAFKVMKKMKKETFELIITDPPYGINVDETTASGEIGVFEDSKDWMHKHMPQYFKECFRVMTANSHMYVFFAISYYEFLLKCAEDAGFTFDPLPLIWVKGKYSGKSGDPIRYPGRCYEMVLYCRKGNMPLVKPGMRNVITEDPVLGADKIHPTEKPIGVIRDLLRRSGHPGIRVLDPMAGSGATLEACMRWGYLPVGIELDESYHARGLDRLGNVFSQLPVSQMRELAEDTSYE
jgi:adenine-specific DNA-methyltransferase